MCISRLVRIVIKITLKLFIFQNSILLHAERKIKMSKYTSHKLRPQKSKHHYKKHNVTEASILSAVRWTKVVLLIICQINNIAF